jgi:hypothetical protein
MKMPYVAYCCETKEAEQKRLWDRTLELTQNAVGTLGKSATTRQLQPEDFGAETNKWSVSVGGAEAGWFTAYTFTVPNYTFIGLHDIFDAGSRENGGMTVTGIRIKAGSCVIRKWHIEEMYATDDRVLVLAGNEPVIIGPGTTVTVEFYVPTTGPVTATVGFSGVVGELSGKNVTSPTLVDC